MKKRDRRPYHMTARAEAVADTATRILDAAMACFWEAPTDRLRLDAVAARAEVTVQTIIRRFGGREGLLVAAGAREVARVSAQRAAAPVGDLPQAVAVLVAHYEAMGDAVLRLVAESSGVPALAPMVAQGRAVHRAWCLRVFAPTLAPLRGGTRARRLAQLMAVCDVTLWHQLRRVAGLSRAQVERALVELLEPLTRLPS